MKKIIRFTVFWMMVFLLCAVSGATFADTSGATEKISLTGFGVAVSLDRTEYCTDFMPPGWTPPVIKMVMCIYNNTSAPITLNFANSKCHDFIIYNSFGAEVWRWSFNRVFLDVVTQTTLQPGETVCYKAECKFVTQDGSPMPEGKYFLKGISTALLSSTVDNKLGMLEAKAPFKHSYTY